MAAGKTNIGGNGLRIKRIQRGVLTATSTSGNTVTIDKVDPNYAIVRYQFMGNGEYNKYSKFVGKFRSDTQLSLDRWGDAGDVQIAWEVIELDPTSVRRVQVVEGNIIVQRYPPAKKDFDISVVDLSKTILVFTWRQDYGDSITHNFSLTFSNSFTLKAEAWGAQQEVEFRAYVIETY